MSTCKPHRVPWSSFPLEVRQVVLTATLDAAQLCYRPYAQYTRTRYSKPKRVFNKILSTGLATRKQLEHVFPILIRRRDVELVDVKLALKKLGDPGDERRSGRAVRDADNYVQERRTEETEKMRRTAKAVRGILES